MAAHGPVYRCGIALALAPLAMPALGHDLPGGLAHEPDAWQAAYAFVVMGFRHILDGIDHLLFVACLVIPWSLPERASRPGRVRGLVVIVTAFTLAHSITLASAALGLVPAAPWFPPLVETFIAASIVYLAIENVLRGEPRRRWAVAFAFGLVHGFGFAFALREALPLAGSHVATALAAFNVGVELGQVAVLMVLVPLLDVAFRRVPPRVGIGALSAAVGSIAAYWLLERAAQLGGWA